MLKPTWRWHLRQRKPWLESGGFTLFQVMTVDQRSDADRYGVRVA
jgi:hypothetical protein